MQANSQLQVTIIQISSDSLNLEMWKGRAKNFKHFN